MNLILLFPEDFVSESVVLLNDYRAQHIQTVLRAGVGKMLQVGMLDGALGSGSVLSIKSNEVLLECRFQKEVLPRPRLDLILAMPRPKVLKRLWAQIAALGVNRLVLMNASKVERFYFDSHVIEPDFYTPLLVEGLQQARCTHLPEVLIEQQFKPFVEDQISVLFSNQPKFLADPLGEKKINQLSLEGACPVLAIGPEGGWTSYERTLLQAYGFELVGLGSRVLRTDTACIALVALFNALL